MKFQKSLRFKLLCVVFLIAVIILFVFGTMMFHSAEASYRTDIPRSLGIQLSSAAGNLERSIIRIMRVPQLISNDSRIRRYLQNDPFGSTSYGSSLVGALSDVNTLIYSANINDYLSKLMLVSARHPQYISVGSVSGHSSDLAIFHELCPEIGVPDSPRILPSPFFYAYQTNDRYIIPFAEPVYYLDGKTPIGTAYIAMGSRILQDQFSTYFKEGGQLVYIRSDETVWEMSPHGFAERSDLFEPLGAAADEVYQNGAFTTGPVDAIDGIGMVGYSLDLLGWTLFLPVPAYHMQLPQYFAAVLPLVLLFAAACVLVVYLVLNHIVARPVAYIQSQLHALTLGDFSERRPLSSDDEFGAISSDITEMSGAFVQLMKTQLEDEKKRNQLSFRALQGQITPHFLYNTLNSIRWLGEMNGVPGMSEMTTALMRMLRHITRIETDSCTLREELAFVHDYEIIQTYRYGSGFSIRYRTDEALMNAKIIKFILQPLVENAMFYGIDPAGGTVLIDIHAYREGDDLLLAVTDNGVGIPPETLEQLRKNAYRSQRTGGASGIALHNIHERLTMEYGSGYGISMRSVVGHYTQITVRVPFEETEPEKASEEEYV